VGLWGKPILRRAPRKQEDSVLQEQATILQVDDTADFDSDGESMRSSSHQNATNSDNLQLSSSARPAASQDDKVVVIDNDIDKEISRPNRQDPL
jgi:hypothetical protein